MYDTKRLCSFFTSLKVTTLCIALVIIFHVSVVWPKEITETRIMMGTFVSITVNKAPKQFKSIINRAFLEITRIESIMSTYSPTSDISILNRKGYLNEVCPELQTVVLRSLYYGRLSAGAFDITIKPVLDLYKRCYQEQDRPPSPSELSETLDLVNFRNVLVEDDQIHLTKQNAQITLDGIAKGYIIDLVIDVLQKNEIHHALVNVGGDMRGIGQSSRAKPWSIALQNPRNVKDYLAIIHLTNQAVATSGDYERFFVQDKTVHHIIDPKTGQSARSLISATVIARMAIDADALATAVFVLGPQEGMELIESLEGIEALLITNKREILMSSGFATGAKLSSSRHFSLYKTRP